ncbi:MAG TPA: proton-conducting transporter membrane subunit [Solirubrobacterales bacterium]|nr:proton-conducting transporter membrane subunit [Solirubrobacterales bacterium]
MAVAPLIIAVPLLVASLLIGFASHAGRRLSEAAALAATLAVLGLCVTLLVRTASGLEIYWFGGWEPREGIAIGISFAVDAFGAGLACLVSLLTVAALVTMSRYRDTDAPHFQVLILLFLAGMTGFCLSGDLFNMFVFFELMSIAAFALAGYKVEEGEAVEGALNFAIVNTIGSFLILTGIALVYGRTGALNLAQIGAALAHEPVNGIVVVSFSLLVAGLLVKAAVVPFHFWLADAYAVAPTPVCILFAGAMSELGLYGVGRIWFDGFAGALGPHGDELQLVLIVLGSVTALLGGAMCFLQDHLKRLLAFATIAYEGIFLIGLGLLSAAGVAGAAIYVVADGFGKAALFTAVAIVQHRRQGRVSEATLHGRGRELPWTGAILLLGALSFAALPPFGTFLGKSMIEDELSKDGYGVVVAVLILTSMLTAGAVLRAGGRVFLGWGEAREGPGSEEEKRSEEEEPRTRTPATLFVPAALLIVASLAVGVVPGLAEAVESAAERFIAGPAYLGAVLHAVPPPPLPAPEQHSAALHSFVFSALTLFGAAALAGASLFGERLVGGGAARLVGRTGAVFRPLRAIHSGHVGDYVAWLVLGVAVLGGALALALA